VKGLTIMIMILAYPNKQSKFRLSVIIHDMG